MIEEKIAKYEGMRDTINLLLDVTDKDDLNEISKLTTVRRFVFGFIDDLKSLKYSENKIG
jgi:hypothetical protein